VTGRADELLARFGSPLFVYDGDAIAARYGRLRAALPAECGVHFAVKANPALGVLALLVRAGAGLEIASAGELLAARAAGCPPGRILFAGPGKRDDELAAAVAAGVRGIHCESEGELRRLDALAAAAGRRARCGLRVHVPWSAGEARPIIGGAGATKFGISEPEARARVGAWARELAHLELAGLHVFNASNVLSAQALLAGARRTFELAADLTAAGLPLEWIDFGGGLGVPYARERELDVEAFGAGLAGLLAEFAGRLPGSLRLAVEPGRWLVAEAGEYLTTVIDRKRCDGEEFAVLDGGVHHLLRPALVGQQHRVRRVWPEGGRGALERVHLVGPLCTMLDSFGSYALPPLAPGAVLAVECAGAYGFTEAMPHFLSHPVPAEVLRRGGRTHLLRERRDPRCHLEGQHVPEVLAPATAGA